MTIIFSKPEISRLADEFFAGRLASETGESVDDPATLSPATRERLVAGYGACLEACEEEYSRREFSRVAAAASSLLRARGVAEPERTEAHRRLCRRMLERLMLLYCLRIEELEGESRGPYHRRAEELLAGLGLGAGRSAQAGPGDTRGKPLSQAIDEYIADYRASDRAWRTSVDGFERMCSLFLRVVGDRELGSIDARVVGGFQETLERLPKYAAKRLGQGTPLHELLTHPTGRERMREATIRNYLQRIRSFFRWAKVRGYVAENPVDGLVRRLQP